MNKQKGKESSIKAAFNYLSKKQITGTTLASKELAALWEDEVKAQAFFSARVSKADILQTFQDKCLKVAQGKISTGTARSWITEFLKTDGKNLLNSMGMLPPDEKNTKITELASISRINLIVEQNVRNAHAVGEWQEVQETKEIAPFLRYKTMGDGLVRHAHALLNNKVYAVDDPIWKKIFPPNDFLCRCYTEKVYEDEAKISKYPDEYLKDTADKTFSFDPAKGLGHAQELKPEWSEQIKEKVKKGSALFVKTEIDFLEKRKTFWLKELASGDSGPDLCNDTIARIDERIKEYQKLTEEN